MNKIRQILTKISLEKKGIKIHFPITSESLKTKKLHKGVSIGGFVRIEGCGTIEILEKTHILRYTEISANPKQAKIRIGKYCSIAPFCLIRTDNHPLCTPSTSPEPFQTIKKEIPKNYSNIEIGHDVWVGWGAIILGGVKIGNGAVIGAGAVVTKRVKPYEIVGGVPATHIKYRFLKSKRDLLNRIKWWDWSSKKMKQNKKFFTTDIKKTSINTLEKYIGTES